MLYKLTNNIRKIVTIAVNVDTNSFIAVRFINSGIYDFVLS